MPRTTPNSEPPEVMTRGKAIPVLVVAAIFDALGFMFEWFIFFGPAMTGLYCDYKVGGLVGSALGLTKAACGTGAAALGFFAAPALIAFGTVMAMIISFAGWLAVLIILLMVNRRIFKENALWFGASLIVTEIPFVGSLPIITFAVWRMYSRQIMMEETAFKKWKKENADAQAQERNRQIAQVMQVQAVQQQVADDELYTQQAASEEIPEEERRAA